MGIARMGKVFVFLKSSRTNRISFGGICGNLGNRLRIYRRLKASEAVTPRSHLKLSTGLKSDRVGGGGGIRYNEI